MIDILEMIKHQVRVTDGPHKGMVGDALTINYETTIPPEAMLVTVRIDGILFEIPMAKLEIVKEG